MRCTQKGMPHLSHLPRQGDPEATTRWDCPSPVAWQGREPLHADGTHSLPRQAWLQSNKKGPYSQRCAAPWRSPDPTSAELPKWWRGQWQNHASDQALPYQKPPRLHPDPSPGQRDAGQGRPGSDLSQLLPLERPNGLDAWKDGTEIHSPCDHLGRGLHSAPPHSGNLPWLARGSGRPDHLLWRPGAAAPNRQRNVTRLAPWACPLLRRGSGRPQIQRPPSQGPQEANPPSARQGQVPRGTKGASCLPRVGALRGGLEAMWSHLDLEADGLWPGPEAAVWAPWEVFSGRPRTSAIPPQRHLAAKHNGHHPWALAGCQARPARARPERRHRGALEICPRGPRRQVRPGLGSWLRPHHSLKPGSHSCRPPQSLDHRRLSPVVQPGLFCSLTGGVS